MEKISIIYRESDRKTVGIMLINEIELGYIKPKVTFYIKNDTFSTHDKNDLIKVLGDFKGNVVNVSTLLKTLSQWLKSDIRTHVMGITEPFELISGNKNKSSRNKHMMISLGITKYERVAINYVGKKIT